MFFLCVTFYNIDKNVMLFKWIDCIIKSYACVTDQCTVALNKLKSEINEKLLDIEIIMHLEVKKKVYYFF